jgi:hypothetical protein
MHPMVLLRDEAQVEAQFSLFGDSANPNASLEILLDAPDETPQ